MDPISLAIAAGLGGATLLGGQMTNAANAQQAQQANILGILSSQAQTVAQQQGQATQMAYNTQATQNAQNFAREMVSRQTQQDQNFLNQAEVFNAQQAGTAMSFSAQQAQQQRDYETSMSSTAYQRAVADMKAAGLNPILSAGTGGASTPSVSAPSGVSASVSAPSISAPTVSAAASPGGISGSSFTPQKATFQNYMGDAVASAAQAAKLTTELKAQNANINVANAQALNNTAQAAAANAAAAKTTSETSWVGPKMGADINNLRTNTALQAERNSNLAKYGVESGGAAEISRSTPTVVEGIKGLLSGTIQNKSPSAPDPSVSPSNPNQHYTIAPWNYGPYNSNQGAGGVRLW